MNARRALNLSKYLKNRITNHVTFIFSGIVLKFGCHCQLPLSPHCYCCHYCWKQCPSIYWKGGTHRNGIVLFLPPSPRCTMHAELPIASFICASLVLIPLPSHWRAGTVPIVAISIWLFLSNFINGLNAIIWAGNVNVVVPVLCDISTSIIPRFFSTSRQTLL